MKTVLIILFILSYLCATTMSHAQAQSKRKYTPLEEFGSDTLAFLKKNFDYECEEDYYNAYHIYRDVKTFMEDIKKALPIKAFRFIKKRATSYNIFNHIEFYYYTPQQIKEKNEKGIPVYCIQMCLLFTENDPLYQEMQKAGIDLEEKLMTWDNKYLELICQLSIGPFYINKYHKNIENMPFPCYYVILDGDDADYDFE